MNTNNVVNVNIFAAIDGRDTASTSQLLSASSSAALIAQEIEDLNLLDDQVADDLKRMVQDTSLAVDDHPIVEETKQEVHPEEAPLEAKTSLAKEPSRDEITGLRRLSVEGLPVDEDKGRPSPSLTGRGRRRSSNIPLGSPSSNSSMTHGSHTSISSLAGSRRRMSIAGGSAGGSTGGIATKSLKPNKPPPPRRNRSQSVEFRLGDFSMLMTTLDDNKEADKMLPQLEADLQALNAKQEADEKKKLEDQDSKTQKKKRKRRSFGKSKTDSQSKSSAGGRRGRMARMQKDGKQGNKKNLAKLTETNLAKFNAQTLGINSPMLQPTAAFQDNLHPHATISSLGTSLKKKKQEFDKKEYGKLSFQEKLEHDDFRLQTLPRISSPVPLPQTPPIDMEDMAVKSKSIAGSQSTSIESKLPEIASQSASTISKPSYRGYNLGETNYRHRHRLLVGAIAADKLAGGPFEKHMLRYERTTEVNYLRFWQATQEYLTTAAYSCDLEGIFLRQRQSQTIIATFLTASGDMFISLGDGLTEELRRQLPRNSGDELLTHAQDLACEAMREAWEAYQKHDRDEFLTRTVSCQIGWFLYLWRGVPS